MFWSCANAPHFQRYFAAQVQVIRGAAGVLVSSRGSRVDGLPRVASGRNSSFNSSFSIRLFVVWVLCHTQVRGSAGQSRKSIGKVQGVQRSSICAELGGGFEVCYLFSNL